MARRYRVFGLQVQEYGVSNPELLEALAHKTTAVTKVPVYQWALPEDVRPLREAVLGVASGGVDVVLFTTGAQAIHLFQVAAEMEQANELRAGLRSMVVVSIGPTTTEVLNQYGINPDFEPTHPKMGFLVNEAAQQAAKLVEEKKDNRARSMSTRQAGLRIAVSRTSGSEKSSTEVSPGDKQAMAPIDFLHEITSRIASADSFHKVLGRIVDFVATVIPRDSCFIYVLEGEKLMLRASKNPHADVIDHLGVKLGQGITGWVAEHREPVALASNASEDPRFKLFKNLPEDRFEAMLSTPILCASRMVGVINLQHRLSYQHTTNEVRLLSTIGYLVGAEVERARLENENAQLAGRLEARKAVERAKGILQRDMRAGEEEAYRMMQREKSPAQKVHAGDRGGDFAGRRDSEGSGIYGTETCGWQPGIRITFAKVNTGFLRFGGNRAAFGRNDAVRKSSQSLFCKGSIHRVCREERSARSEESRDLPEARCGSSRLWIRL